MLTAQHARAAGAGATFIVEPVAVRREAGESIETMEEAFIAIVEQARESRATA